MKKILLMLSGIVTTAVLTATSQGRDIILETTSNTMTVREKAILWIKSEINTLQIGVSNGVITASIDGTPLPKQVETSTDQYGKIMGSKFWSDVAWKVVDYPKIPTQQENQDMKDAMAMLAELSKKKDLDLMDIITYQEEQTRVSANQINKIRCKEITFTPGR